MRVRRWGACAAPSFLVRLRNQRLLALACVVLVLFLLPSGARTLQSARGRSPRTTSSAAVAIVRGVARLQPRVLVSIAVHRAAGAEVGGPHLSRILEELLAYRAAGFDVSVVVDTNAPALSAWLAASPAAAFSRARLWSVEELGNPLHLPFVHRHLWQDNVDAHDFFIYTEDDILLPLASFALYLKHQGGLWSRGWLFGWVRAELWRADNATPISVDNIIPREDAPLYRAPAAAAAAAAPEGGELVFAEPWSPYTAFYILSASQLRSMIDDSSGVWHGGFAPFLPRERMSIGYNYAKSAASLGSPYGADGWRARVLVPLTLPQGSVHPAAIAWHLPNKYAHHAVLGFKDLAAVRVADVFNWTRGGVGPVGPVVDLPMWTSMQ